MAWEYYYLQSQEKTAPLHALSRSAGDGATPCPAQDSFGGASSAQGHSFSNASCKKDSRRPSFRDVLFDSLFDVLLASWFSLFSGGPCGFVLVLLRVAGDAADVV